MGVEVDAYNKGYYDFLDYFGDQEHGELICPYQEHTDDYYSYWDGWNDSKDIDFLMVDFM